MKHSQEEYWRPRFHAPPLRSHPDPPPTIQCSWYPYEGQCPYMRLALICWRSNGECTFTDMQKNIDEVFHYLIIKNEKEFWTLITCYSKNDTKAKNCVDQIYKNVKIKDKK